MKIKRYIVFGYNHYYPGGGWTDYLESFDLKEDAEEFIKNQSNDMYDLIDSETGENSY